MLRFNVLALCCELVHVDCCTLLNDIVAGYRATFESDSSQNPGYVPNSACKHLFLTLIICLAVAAREVEAKHAEHPRCRSFAVPIGQRTPRIPVIVAHIVRKADNGRVMEMFGRSCLDQNIDVDNVSWLVR